MDDYIDSEGDVSTTKKRNGSDADNVLVSMSEEEEPQMESEDEEKDLKAASAPTIRLVLDFFLARTLVRSLAETVFWTSSSSLCLSQRAEL